jgi:hypothetical protein
MSVSVSIEVSGARRQLAAMQTIYALLVTAALGALLQLGPSIQVLALAQTAEDDWEESWDEDWDLEARVAAVNDGELRFLPPEAASGHHVHFNRIRIDSSSLRGGWIDLEQCHEQMDAVPAAQILFNPERIRRLRILSAEGIGRAWVEGHSVQLEDVGRGARLCVGGESRALSYLGEGRYRLQNGPYMRRFLDGYYPMRVVLQIQYPSDLLRFEAPRPGLQPGLEVLERGGELQVDATFEGRLFTCMDFLALGRVGDLGPSPPCPEDQGPVQLR